MILRFLILNCYILFSFIFISCQEKDDKININNNNILPNIPDYFPEFQIPNDNQLTKERVQLGEKLFFSPLLSNDKSISCGTCHLPNIAFANNEKNTPGVFGREGTRNVPSLLNIIFHNTFLREGSVPTLEQQVLVPVQEHNEFDNDWLTIINRLNLEEELLTLLYKSEYIFPADGKKITEFNPFAVTRAISAYQRTLLSINSKYDKYLQKKVNFNQSEELGYKLFKSDSLNCSKCHSGALLTNLNFYNNGLYENYQDIGRARFTLDNKDIGKFKVPSLRNVEKTYPYMFDGSLNTLEDVINHYQSGGKNHQNKSNLIQKFSLTENEKKALIDFLKTLTEE
jgi:cytochrome c peroxidase